MIITGILASVTAALLTLVVGWEYSERIGDSRGIVGGVFAALVLATGLSWTFGL